jgi:hypothetical protein
MRNAHLTPCRIVPISGVLKAELSRPSRRRDVKLILPLVSLAGAVTLLFNSWAAASLSYL